MAAAPNKKCLRKWWWGTSWIHAHGMWSVHFQACDSDLSYVSFRFWIHLIHQAGQHLRRKSSHGSRTKFIRRFFKKCFRVFNLALTMVMLIFVRMASFVCYTLVSWLNRRMQKKQPTSVDAAQPEQTTHVRSAWFRTQTFTTSLVKLQRCALQKICARSLLVR